MAEELSSREAYLEGRLIGLNELVLILKDAIEGKEGVDVTDIIRSIVQHIAKETDSIIEEMKETRGIPHPVIKAAEAKAVGIAREFEKLAEPVTAEVAAPALKRQVKTADELLKGLMALREKRGESESE